MAPTKDWPHAPVHRIDSHGIYMVTGATLHQLPGREVWFNFWDTKLTYERSYLARLNYVHQNAVKHRLVNVANQYPWCSAAWFERIASVSAVKTIYSFKADKLKIHDDY
jgi:putative transposase